MSKGLSIEVSGDIDLDAAGRALQDKIPEFRKWIADYFKEKILDGFKYGSDPWGVPWAPLAKSTLERRRQRGNLDSSPLVDTGEMRRSLLVEDVAGTATLSMDGPAMVHQFGSSSKHIPKRPIFPIDPTSEQLIIPDSWSRDIDNYLDREVNEVLKVL